MNTKVLAGFSIVLALILGGIGAFKSSPVPTQHTITAGGTSPEISSPYLAVGGVTEWYAHTSLIQASTTVCAIQTPPATTTATFININESVSSTSASIIEIGNSGVPDGATGQGIMATTTLIGTKYSLVANAAVDITASTTPTGGKATMFGPSSWLIIKQAVANVTAIANPTGFCTAKFVQTAY